MEHSAILLTCIKRLSVLKPILRSSSEWPLKAGLTVDGRMKVQLDRTSFLLQPGLHAFYCRGCELAISTHVNTTSKKFRELLPALTSCHLSNKTCGHVYSSCMQRVMLNASVTWLLTKPNRLSLHSIASTYQARGHGHHKVKRTTLKLELENLDLILRERSLRWYVSLILSENNA